MQSPCTQCWETSHVTLIWLQKQRNLRMNWAKLGKGTTYKYQHQSSVKMFAVPEIHIQVNLNISMCTQQADKNEHIQCNSIHLHAHIPTDHAGIHKHDLTARLHALWLLLLSRILTRWGLMLTSALSYTKGKRQKSIHICLKNWKGNRTGGEGSQTGSHACQEWISTKIHPKGSTMHCYLI